MLPLALTEQHPFPLSHAEGLAMSERPITEGCRMIHHLQAIIGRRPLTDILHAHPSAFPVMGGEHDLAVVSARVARGWLDDEESKLACIGAAIEVSHCHGMAVVPARAGGPGRKSVEQRLSRGDNRRALFRCAVYIGGVIEPMPVNEIRIAGVVDDVDRNRFALLQA
jgi:hypothetical protein